MALATLYSRALQVDKSLPRCYGIIIDHKARAESAEEAQWVAEQLRSKFDMDSTIIPLEWAEGMDLTSNNRFETDARHFRYRALGLTCKQRKITSLMTAHHANDQAETVMMRLLVGRWRSGLQGMQSVQSIPECYGLHGIYHSGALDGPDMSWHKSGRLPYPIEQGGIRLLRPLLEIEKNRLIGTCEHYGTLWVEDKTNVDKTLTMRNTVRHITQHHKLPTALSTGSLISLAQRMRERIDSLKDTAEHLFNQCPIRLDIQTGSLIVRFPQTSSLLSRPLVTESDKNQARDVAYLLIERVADLVSPKEAALVGRFSSVVELIYPTLSQVPSEAQETKETFANFGLWFKKWDSPSPFNKKGEFPHRHDMEWLLTRQPFAEKDTPKITIPPLSVDPAASNQWHLFDGRFWLRLRNTTPADLTIRPFKVEDLMRLSTDIKAIGRGTNRSIRLQRAALSLIKPAKLRHILPAVFQKDGGRDVLVALPTLNVSALELVCDVRYKKVVFGTRSPKEIVMPGISRHDILVAARQLEKDAPISNRVGKRRRETQGQANSSKRKEHLQKKQARVSGKQDTEEDRNIFKKLRDRL
ncbi:hypothetical protein CC78DRAFT_103842 [Lojkania enalia]|uniref:tRNA(Ile)-lysidine synthetase n=1 Tax=Lojkania enalia TaxID=147567 RepID=A0A9P4KIK0_9PLEO|nr:hypothetical protein CC78DRAFT_103842 [Didymosphaeria enalia]